MGLSRVWVQTVADGLIRADSIVGITTHRTPAIAGKPARWLLDVVLPTTTGSGSDEGWISTPLHRTLDQSDGPPTDAPVELARRLARRDALDAAGVISVVREHSTADTPQAAVRFHFTPFLTADVDTDDPEPRHTDINHGQETTFLRAPEGDSRHAEKR
jgi:hypothetical protein